MPPTPKKPFAYYSRLGAADKQIYRRSDAIGDTPLSQPADLKPLVIALRAALETGERRRVQSAAAKLARALLADLGVSPVTLEILESRPRNDYGELHGLYTFNPASPEDKPRIQVWMRTAAHQRIVAWKSFLRTLLHELGHHLDYHYYDFADSFHTQGFYQRESSLYAQIVDEEPTAPTPPNRKEREPVKKTKSQRRQLRFPGL